MEIIKIGHLISDFYYPRATNFNVNGIIHRASKKMETEFDGNVNEHGSQHSIWIWLHISKVLFPWKEGEADRWNCVFLHCFRAHEICMKQMSYSKKNLIQILLNIIPSSKVCVWNSNFKFNLTVARILRSNRKLLDVFGNNINVRPNE